MQLEQLVMLVVEVDRAPLTLDAGADLPNLEAEHAHADEQVVAPLLFELVLGLP